MAEFHEFVLRTAFGSSEEKSALPLCCCVLTVSAETAPLDVFFWLPRACSSLLPHKLRKIWMVMTA